MHKGWINRHNLATSRAADVVVAEGKDRPLPCSMGETETVRSSGFCTQRRGQHAGQGSHF